MISIVITHNAKFLDSLREQRFNYEEIVKYINGNHICTIFKLPSKIGDYLIRIPQDNKIIYLYTRRDRVDNSLLYCNKITDHLGHLEGKGFKVECNIAFGPSDKIDELQDRVNFYPKEAREIYNKGYYDLTPLSYVIISDKEKQIWNMYLEGLKEVQESKQELLSVKKISNVSGKGDDNYVSLYYYKDYSKEFKTVMEKQIQTLKIEGTIDRNNDYIYISFRNQVSSELDKILTKLSNDYGFKEVRKFYTLEVSISVKTKNVPESVYSDVESFLDEYGIDYKSTKAEKGKKYQIFDLPGNTELIEELRNKYQEGNFLIENDACWYETKSQSIEYRKKILDGFRSNISIYNPISIDDINNDSQKLDIHFEAEDIIQLQDLKEKLTEIGNDFSEECLLDIPNTDGRYTIKYAFDEEKLNGKYADFINEDVSVVRKDKYDSFKKGNGLSDNDKFNEFLRDECSVIGTCVYRTHNSIKIRLNPIFYNNGKFKFHPELVLYAFFPSTGASVELKRQEDAYKRLTRIPDDRTIYAPINEQIRCFLFDATKARDIKEEDVKSQMESIKKDNLLSPVQTQIEAIAKAILAPDIALIQGPPGTGKTTVIAELIWQILKEDPASKILVTSQSNLAVDNALGRIKEKIHTSGNSDNTVGVFPLRVYSDYKDSPIDDFYSKQEIENWVKSREYSYSNNIIKFLLENIYSNISSNKRNGNWPVFVKAETPELKKQMYDIYKKHINVIGATCSFCGSNSFKNTFKSLYDLPYVAFDVVIMDEASKATPLEMAVPLVLGRKVIVIGDHKQLPPFLNKNGIDKALKLAGKEEKAVRLQSIKESQFKKLFLQAEDKGMNIYASLKLQWRMHESIMNAIKGFYVTRSNEDGLKCGLKFRKMDDPDYLHNPFSRYHGISIPPFITIDTHAVWVNMQGDAQKHHYSWYNKKECEAVATIIKILEKTPSFQQYVNSFSKSNLNEIGVITFYKEQKRKIKECLSKVSLQCSYNVDTVDNFQGMERNIIIVSTVRSSSAGNDSVGFTKEIERINVAFSRARSLLIIIGDRNLFEKEENYKNSISAMEHVEFNAIRNL